jgi:hypothetical protein
MVDLFAGRHGKHLYLWPGGERIQQALLRFDSLPFLNR